VGGAVREVNGGAVAGTLARSFADDGAESQVVFLAKNGQNGIVEGDSAQAEAMLEAVPESLLAEPEAVRAALTAGGEVMLTGRSGLRQTPLVGTRVRHASSEKSA
jgi:hypothetical protein